MNDKTLKIITILKEIISQYGPPNEQNITKYRGILHDLLVDYERELNLLRITLEQGLVFIIIKDKNSKPFEIQVRQIVGQLHNTCGMDISAAEWAIRTWTEALEIYRIDTCDTDISAEKTEPDAINAIITQTQLKHHPELNTTHKNSENFQCNYGRSIFSPKKHILGLVAIIIIALFVIGLIYGHSIPSATGTFITKWGTEGSENGQFIDPDGIAVAPDGRIYVVDSGNNRIQVFDVNGNFITKLNGQYNHPNDVAISPNGNVYITDPGKSPIQVFDVNGNFITKWGTEGSENGQFSYPSGVVVAPNGQIYVVDSGNNRIQVFDANGTFITKWGTLGSGNGQFRLPKGIEVVSNGRVFVADWENSRIQVFDTNGNYITQWGTEGSENGQFSLPSDVMVAPNGQIYVVDSGNNRIQVFDANGNFITKWGTGGSENSQFNLALSIAVTPNGNVYITDSQNERIQEFSA